MTTRYTLSSLDAEALEAKFGEQTLLKLEESYGADLSEGATVAELEGNKKAGTSELEDLLDNKRIDSHLPLIVLSKNGFTDAAADRASEYEEVVLCTMESGRWAPQKIPA